jgi:hypothetical protein
MRRDGPVVVVEAVLLLLVVVVDGGGGGEVIMCIGMVGICTGMTAPGGTLGGTVTCTGSIMPLAAVVCTNICRPGPNC